MADKKFYCGQAKEIHLQSGKTKMSVELNLTQLWEALKDPAVKETLRKWKSKDGTENTTVKLEIWELNEPREYSTHSVSVDLYKPADKPARTGSPVAQSQGFKNQDDFSDLPF